MLLINVNTIRAELKDIRNQTQVDGTEIKVMTTQNKSEVLITLQPGTDLSQTKEVANSINNTFMSIGKDIKPLDTCNLPAYHPIPSKTS